MPEARRADQGRRGQEGAPRRDAPRATITRPFQRSSAEALGEAPPHAHRHPARAEHLLDGAVLAHLLRGARHPERRTSSSPTRPPRRCGTRAASTARSIRATRRRSRRRTSTTCSSTSTRREEAAQLHLLPVHHARAVVRRRTQMDTRRCPIVAGAPEGHEGGVHEGDRLLRRARHQYLDPAVTFTEPLAAASSRCSTTWGPLLGITEDENDFACRRGVEGARRRSTTRCRAQGPRDPREVEAENRVAILMLGRPYHSDPGLNHGVLEEFQVLGYPILSMRSIPKDRDVARRAASTRTSRAGVIETPLDVHRRVAGELLGQLACRRCGRRSSPRATRTSSCLDLSIFKCGHDAPTYGLIDIDHRDVGDAVLGAARHRRQQAGRLDQDPRQDLRAHAEAPRGAARGHGDARRTSSIARASTRSGSSCSSCKQQQLEASRSSRRRRSTRRSKSSQRKVARRTQAEDRRRSCPKAKLVAARQEAQGRQRRSDQAARRRPAIVARERSQRHGNHRRAATNDKRRSKPRPSRSSVDIDAELQAVRAERAQAPRPRAEQAKHWLDDIPDAQFTATSARTRRSSISRPDHGARPVHPGRAARHRLQGQGARRARTTTRSSSARSSATAASATRPTSPSATS